MIRSAIVEDDAASAALIKGYLERFATERQLSVRSQLFSDAESIVQNYKCDFDIIFIDIELGLLDGMSAARIIRDLDPEVILIFITNLSQYAIQGYSVEALDYMLKPVSYFAFSQRMLRALDRLEKNKDAYIRIPIKGGEQKLTIHEITYVESRGHNLLYHTRDGEVLTRCTMQEAESVLAPYGFSRCNKGYLLNLEYVDAIRDGCACVGNDKLLISRGRKTAFLQALTDYLGSRTK